MPNPNTVCHLTIVLISTLTVSSHISYSLAITRDNRFLPLKDGVWDPKHERSLLGADLPAIIDALSLGWYESLFQSYMATKVSLLSVGLIHISVHYFD